jgi:transcriptional regulator with XRE-family HTH domain
VTQKQLAARARTSQAQISRIERDETSPSIATLANLLDLLGEELELASNPVDYGHDITLNRANLDRTPTERLRHGVSFANFVVRTQAANDGA